MLIAGVAIFFAVIFALLNPAPTKPRSEQIAEGCQREFGAQGEQAVNECRLSIMMRESGDRERAKLDRAAR